MNIRKIDTENKSDVRRFIKFPFEVYKSNPYWVPPMVADMKLALNREKHPFFKHSQADFFLAEEGNRVLGRITAIDNQRYKEFAGENTGFFYFFEVIEDAQVSKALFDTVFDVARYRGLEEIIGPKGLAQGDGLGMLVEGFEYTPAMGIPYTPDYYNHLVTDSGFEKNIDYLSGYLTADFKIPERIHNIAERVKKSRGFMVKNYKTKEEVRKWIPEIREVYNQAFATVPAFVPISEDEVQLIADRILSIADLQLVKLIFKDDDLIGFLFSYHNISAGIQKAKGRMLPFGWFHIMQEFKKTRWMDMNGIGLVPNHQGVGATAVLYSELEKSTQAFRFEKADVVQIAEKNLKSFTEMSNLGVNWHKRHRIYKRSL